MICALLDMLQSNRVRTWTNALFPATLFDLNDRSLPAPAIVLPPDRKGSLLSGRPFGRAPVMCAARGPLAEPGGGSASHDESLIRHDRKP
jgi:hypothetical protein